MTDAGKVEKRGRPKGTPNRTGHDRLKELTLEYERVELREEQRLINIARQEGYFDLRYRNEEIAELFRRDRSTKTVRKASTVVADTDESSLETSDNDIPISASTTGEDKATNWENEECNTLIRGITKGKTLAEVAALVERTETDVLRKAENLRKSGVIGEKLMQGLQKELERDPNAET